MAAGLARQQVCASIGAASAAAEWIHTMISTNKYKKKKEAPTKQVAAARSNQFDELARVGSHKIALPLCLCLSLLCALSGGAESTVLR